MKEIDIQKEIVRNLYDSYPDCLVIRVPNEAAKRRFHTSTGLLKGASDLILLLPGRIAFLEVKQPSAKKNLSDEQIAFRDKVLELGFEHYVVWSPEQALESIKTK